MQTAEGGLSGEVRQAETEERGTLLRRLPSRWNVLEFALLPLVIVVLAVGSLAAGGGWLLVPFLFIFGVVPVLDLWVGVDSFNPPAEVMKALSEQKIYRLVTWLWVPVEVGILLWSTWLASWSARSMLELVVMAGVMGLLSGGIGITFAHELGHKTNRTEQTLSKILLLCCSYMHFFIEHNLGHHTRVATPEDPATARQGETFYRFYPRTVIGSMRSAWALEARRLSRAHRGLYSVHNQMLWFIALPLALALGLGALWGVKALLFFILQSIAAFSLLEIVNYLEHYGLTRREVAPGQYERVTPEHSWNSNNKITNGFLIMLQRHSDHHANPQRRYQTLRHLEEAPQLPTGYAGMLLLALLPPLWFRVMDPRVAAWHARRAQQSASPASGAA